MLHALRNGKFNVHAPAVAERHDKEAESAPGFSHAYGVKGAPANLSALARGKRELEEGASPCRSYR